VATLRAFPTLLLTWLATGGGAFLGSVLGNSASPTGLYVGGAIGGAAGLALGVLLASRMGWLPLRERGGALLGGLIGFAIATPIALSNLHTPVTPVLACGLAGIGALFGAGVARGLAAAILLLAGWTAAAPAQTPAAPAQTPAAPRVPGAREAVLQRASGTFEVTLTPLAPAQDTAGSGLGRMAIDKRFAGDLAGTSRGEMLTAMTGTKGSAGYVAIERVTGTLQGRQGSFVLQHSGTMTRGEPGLRITVVPDSGTGELAGLTGSMTIVIADGKHSYLFEYTLLPSP
jgi:hypothetical protein